MRICVIPARGGSKRIPKKNIRNFCGKPIIAWSIETALQSSCFDEVIVTTDNDEIAELANVWGANTPFKRPDYLSDDFTGTIPVIAHATQWYLDHGVDLKAVCCLYATAPFVRVSDLVNGSNLLDNCDEKQFVFTATEFPSSIQRSFFIDRVSGSAKMCYPEKFNQRSQDIEPCYYDAGQFYWGRPSAWLESQDIFTGSKPLLLPNFRVRDIDTEVDWKYAELMSQILSTDVDLND